MTAYDKLSVYVPQEKLKHRPVERLSALAEKRDRSMNHLVVEAILQYLDEQEPLKQSRPEKPAKRRQTTSPPKKSKPIPKREQSLKKEPEEEIKEATQEQPMRPVEAPTPEQPSESSENLERPVHELAIKHAAAINEGRGPAFVSWNERRTKIHVVMSKAVPDDELPPGMSLDDWRAIYRGVIAGELMRLNWISKGGNRFWRPGADRAPARPAPKQRSASSAAQKSGCLVAVAAGLAGILMVSMLVLDRSKGIEMWNLLGPTVFLAMMWPL